MPQAQLEIPNVTIEDIERIYARIQPDLLAVQESLKRITPPDTELLAESISHSMSKQGKMLRPVLSILASGASGRVDQAHIETAAVAELIHVATLLHDDVLDKADLRRGQQTTRAVWGNKISILSGDYLLAQASLKLSMLDNCRLVSIFARVLSNLCEGEVEQIRSSFSIQTSWDSYFRKSICKTAALFSACCESSGVLNQLSEEQIERLKSFGEKFGIAFQMMDDLLDYTSSAQQLGKPVLDDLKNGLLNAPILLALESMPPDSTEYNQLVSLIQTLFMSQENHDQDEAVKASLFELFEAHDIIPRTLGLAQQYVTEAIASIDFLPESDYRSGLAYMAQYAIQRQS